MSNNNQISSPNSGYTIFLTPSGNITPPSFLLLVAAPLLLSGQVFSAFGIICLAFCVAVKAAMEDIKEVDKQEIRYNIFEPEDLLAELEAVEEEETSSEDNQDYRQQQERRHAKCFASLSAFANKYNKKDKNRDKEDHKEKLALICQQAAYLTMRLYPEQDDIVTGAISLLALVAKDLQVRQRTKFQADMYGFDPPIKCLQKALERAKTCNEEEKEEQLAETLRKGCLYLGAIADGDQDYDLGIKVVEEDGLELILEAANWFRFHEGVASWALWAIFILGYEHLTTKLQLVRLGGITTICQLLKNNPNSLEVSRHGVAVLFDLLREQGEASPANIKFDPWEVRRQALSAGFHEVLLNAMKEFSDSMDIMMMSQEMLIGTGFRGDIPQYQQP